MNRSQVTCIMLVCTIAAGCASTYDVGGPRRPDGTLFESNAEYRAAHGLPPAAASPAAVKSSPAPVEPSPGSLSYLDFKNGFRDLKFGDPPTSGMRLAEEKGHTTVYQRPGDDHHIGNANVHEILYVFYKGRLSHVLLKTKGFSDSRALLDVLRQAYGSGHRPNRFLEEYYWFGSRVDLSYHENATTNDASVLFASIPLKQEQEADDKAKARKGVSGL
jgi:hypothetical protein